jgi:hypothetical protein
MDDARGDGDGVARAVGVIANAALMTTARVLRALRCDDDDDG